MAWSEIQKAINSEIEKPLNVLIKERTLNVYAGTTLRMSSDSVSSQAVPYRTGSISAPIKRFRVGVTGTIKVTFDVKETIANASLVFLTNITSGHDAIASETAATPFKINAHGIVNNTTTSFVSQTMYASVQAGDEIIICGSGATGQNSTVSVQNARVYYDFNPTDTVLI